LRELTGIAVALRKAEYDSWKKDLVQDGDDKEQGKAYSIGKQVKNVE